MGKNNSDENHSEARNEEKKEEEKKSVWQDILELIVYCAVILLATFLIVHFVGQRTKVIGSSMYPTLVDGDNLIVDKISYRLHEPKRFDIIVFPSPDEPGRNYIKRIIGLPGESVQIIDSVIYINGEVLEENYGSEPTSYAGVAENLIHLGEDEYFVLGDNRGISKDSRYDVVGNIHKDHIIGRAWMRIWPLNKFGFLKHQ